MPVPEEGLVVVGGDGLARVDPGGLVRTTNGVDNRCCCGRAGCVACFGATVCCGPSGCGRRVGDGPPVLRKFAVSGTGLIQVSDRIAPPYNGGFAADFRPNGDPSGFGPVRIPPAWTRTPGVPDGNCRWENGAHGSADFFPIENFRYRYVNTLRWETDLTQPSPFHARLDFTQAIEDTIFRRGVLVRATLYPGQLAAYVQLDRGARSPDLPYTVDEVYRAGPCSYGMRASVVSSGRIGPPEQPNLDLIWNLNFRIDACWSLCACTGADPGARPPGVDDPRARAAFEEQVSRRMCEGCGEGWVS